MFGKVDLPPALCAAQLSDPFARRHADVTRHPFIIELAFALYLAHPLSHAKRGQIESLTGSSGTFFLHGLLWSISANQKRKHGLH